MVYGEMEANTQQKKFQPEFLMGVAHGHGCHMGATYTFPHLLICLPGLGNKQLWKCVRGTLEALENRMFKPQLSVVQLPKFLKPGTQMLTRGVPALSLPR